MRLTTIQSSALAMTNRTAVNASGGNSAKAALVMLKLRPQMRQTRSIARSERRDDEDGGTREH